MSKVYFSQTHCARSKFLEAFRESHDWPPYIEKFTILPEPHNGAHCIATATVDGVALNVKVLTSPSAALYFKRDHPHADIAIVIVKKTDTPRDIRAMTFSALRVLRRAR